MIIISFFIQQGAQSALPSLSQKAVPFYRYQHSLFPSGQERIEVLKKSARTEDFKIIHHSAWNKKEYPVEGSALYKDLHLSKIVETKRSSTLYLQKSLSSKPIRILKEKISLEVLRIDEFWAFVKTQEGLAGYLPISQLQAVFNDIGFFVVIHPTQLRMKANETSSAILQIDPGEKFDALAFEGDYIRVKKNHQTGYLSLNHLVSKFDLAHWVFSKKTQWTPVRYRQGSQMMTTDGRLISLSEIVSLVTRPNSGLISRPLPELPPVRTQVHILRTEVFQWNQSILSGHGPVWWKDFVIEPIDRIAQYRSQIDLEHLLKRELFSVAFESPNSLKGLVSSQGIYLSQDGKIWSQLSQFGASNHPVAIHPEGPWFVGTQISYDQGKTFEPFLNPEHLAKKIPLSSRQVKVSKIEPLSNYQVRIHLDIGGRTHTLKSRIGNWNWN